MTNQLAALFLIFAPVVQEFANCGKRGDGRRRSGAVLLCGFVFRRLVRRVDRTTSG